MPVGANGRHAAEKAARVGVKGSPIDDRDRTLFDQTSGIENADPIAETPHRAEIVADEQHRGAVATTQAVN